MVKLSHDALKRFVFSRVGVLDDSVVVGPGIGLDAAVIDVNKNLVAVHTDPITGAIEYLGWLSVYIPSNDVAVAGAIPKWISIAILLPEGSDISVLDKITRGVDEACKDIGVSVVGGHTEFAPGIDKPIVVSTVIGLVINKPTLAFNVKPGDVIVATKSAGLEGSAILCSDFADELKSKGVPEDVLKRCREHIKLVSVVKEAVALAKSGYVHAMHDPTEGGVVGGLTEMAYASNTTIEVWEESIPIAQETRVVANALGIDPLKMLSSGMLLAAVPKAYAVKVLDTLRSMGVEASIIGYAKEREGKTLLILHRADDRVERYEDVYVEDEIMKLWSRRTGNTTKQSS